MVEAATTLQERLKPVYEDVKNEKEIPDALLLDLLDKNGRKTDSMVQFLKPFEIPKIPQFLIDRLPEGKLAEIEAEAHKIVKGMGLPDDAALADVQAGKYADRLNKEPQAESKPNPENVVTTNKRASKWTNMVANAVLATTALGGMAAESNTTRLPERPPIHAMEAVGTSRDRRTAQNRKGVTVVELLVVIGIIGALAAMILPAVQQARDAARETQWQNNMRQVGLAIHNFEAAHNKFPHATSMVKANDGTMVPHSWVVDVLPFMGEQALANKYDKRKPLEQQTDEVKRATLSVLTHPSHPSEEGRGNMVALSSSGFTATHPDFYNNENGLEKNGMFQLQGDFNVGMPPQVVRGNDGRWKRNGPGTTASLRDGLSNTAIVGTLTHKAGNRDPWLDGKVRVTGLFFGTEIGQSHVNGGRAGNQEVPNNVLAAGFIPHQKNGQYVTHLMADGSVQRVAPAGHDTEGSMRYTELVNGNDGKIPGSELGRQ